jgi:hypothetical protein
MGCASNVVEESEATARQARDAGEEVEVLAGV